MPDILRREGWPEGFQVLCHSCNSSKHLSGTCVHKSTQVLTRSEVHV
jgi:hypothetical protein